MEPSSPRPRRARMAVLLVLLAVTTMVTTPAPAIAGSPYAAEPSDLITEEVSFRSGEVTLEGTVFAPAGEDTARPGIVLVPGSGAGVPREVYQPHAEAFARAGIVTLVYDKRGTAEGYSLFEASITDLADDATAGVRLLRDRPDVDPDMVGVHGHSEGGWTVLVAGTRSAEIGFVVSSAPSGRTPERTQVWMNQVQLRHAGVSPSLLRPLGENLTRHVVGADLFRLAGQDPVPLLERLDQPLLGIVAEHDRATPPGETLRIYGEALDRGGHAHYTLRVIDDAHHEMVPTRDGFDVGHLGDAANVYGLAPGYVETVTRWVHDLSQGLPEPSADPAPAQPLQSAPLAPLTRYETPAMLVAVPLTLLLTFGSYPLTALVAWLRGRRGTPPGRWAARVATVVGLALPPATICYLGYIMLSAGMDPLGPVVAGRPLPWLLLQAAVLVAAGATVTLLARWWRERHRLTPWTHARFGALVAGCLLLLPWAAYWGLLAG